MRRTVKLSALGIVASVALWLGISLATARTCSAWNPFSCHGADPELVKLVR